jgi:hypothetical protein
MTESSFKCEFCGKQSGYARRAAQAPSEAAANPYAKQTRQYRCEDCGRINTVERSGYDWTVIDRQTLA